jgi:ABC-2 type transport system permease protein
MYIAIGIFASAVTRSQLIAALLAFALTILVTVGSRYLPEIIEVRSAPNSLYALAIDHVQMFQQETDFVNGKFDTRAPVLYASLAGLFLFLSMMAVDARSARN